jgi:hypothetical protein
LLQTGAAYVSTERINSLYRVILLGMDNESRAWRRKSWRKMLVALSVTEVKCLVNRSLGSSRRPRYRTCEFHWIIVGFEPTVSAGERPQTYYTFDPAVTYVLKSLK